MLKVQSFKSYMLGVFKNVYFVFFSDMYFYHVYSRVYTRTTMYIRIKIFFSSLGYDKTNSGFFPTRNSQTLFGDLKPIQFIQLKAREFIYIHLVIKWTVSNYRHY